MRINLHVLKQDLEAFDLQGSVVDRPALAACERPLLCSQAPATLRTDVIYVIDARNLGPKPPARFQTMLKSRGQDAHPSILCCGKPSERWLESGLNILYSCAECTLDEMTNAVLDVFQRYAHWEESLQRVVDEHLAPYELASRSIDLFGNPLFAQSSAYEGIFFAMPGEAQDSELLKDYMEQWESAPAEGEPAVLTEEAITLLNADEEFRQAAHAVEASIYSGKPFGYQTLFYNCMVDDAVVARVTVDGIFRPITERDHVLITVLGSYVTKLWNGRNLHRIELPKSYRSAVEGLLAHRLLPMGQLKHALSEVRWNMFDEYLVFVLESGIGTESHRHALPHLALDLAKSRKAVNPSAFEGRIVLVCNLTQEGCTRSELISSLAPIMRDQLTKASFSASFGDFKNLYYYYRQALGVERAGMQRNPMFWIFRYEDYAMDLLLARCLQDSIADANYPPGLNALVEHDKRKGSTYVELLRTYLDCDRNVAETARVLFLHRNTLRYQLERIHEILKIDLDDPDNRIVLQIALRLLDAEKES